MIQSEEKESNSQGVEIWMKFWKLIKNVKLVELLKFEWNAKMWRQTWESIKVLIFEWMNQNDSIWAESAIFKLLKFEWNIESWVWKEESAIFKLLKFEWNIESWVWKEGNVKLL